MGRNKLMALAFATTTALVVYGCADSTAPTDAGRAIGAVPLLHHTGVVPPADTVYPLKRLKELQYDLTASAVIGPEGGAIKIFEAGGKIEIPRGALTEPTLITMTALKGWNVAYEFQPHGLVFLPTDAGVKITQDLKPTYAARDDRWIANAEAGYFESADTSFIGQYRLFAYASELRPAEVEELKRNARTIRFWVTHFSGYLVSSGRKPAGMDISQY